MSKGPRDKIKRNKKRRTRYKARKKQKIGRTEGGKKIKNQT